MTDNEKRLFAQPSPEPEDVRSEKPSKPDNTGFETVHFEKNQVIFKEGDPGDAVYLIVHGMVDIRKGVMSEAPKILATLTRGDVFGEMALFDDSPRMAEAFAHSSVEVIAIDREEFNRRLNSMDPVIKSITVYLVSRVRHMADEFMNRKESDN